MVEYKGIKKVRTKMRILVDGLIDRKLWNKYLDMLSKKERSKIENISDGENIHVLRPNYVNLTDEQVRELGIEKEVFEDDWFDDYVWRI